MNRKQRRAQGTSGNKKRPSPPTGAPALESAALTLAERLRAEGNGAAASDIYIDILARDADNLAALYNLGFMLYQNNAAGEAAKLLGRFLRIRPDDSRALAALAGVKVSQGLFGEAVGLADRARRLDPSGATLARLGSVYNVAGKQAAAKEAWTEAIAKDPTCTDVYLNLQKIERFSPQDPRFLQLLALEGNSALVPEDNIFLHFALAQAFLGQDVPDKAFAHYATANRLKRASFRGYDVARAEQAADDIIRLFDAALVAKHGGAVLKKEKNEKEMNEGERGDKAVFIVGMPRSGSTLVERILSSHPEAGSVGESQSFRRSLPADPSAPHRPAPAAWFAGNLSAEMLDGIARNYLSTIRQAGAGKKRVVDKMLFNYLHIGLIRLALPGAKIIHCARDPVDIGLSLWQGIFDADMPWAYDMGEIGRYYRAYARVMAHWQALFPGDIHTVTYETLIANQEQETRKLLEFCGLSWDDRCLRFHENEAPVSTASAEQVRRPLYKDSTLKWKRYEKYLGRLIESLGDAKL